MVRVREAGGRVLDVLAEVRRKEALGQAAVAARIGGIHLCAAFNIELHKF